MYFSNFELELLSFVLAFFGKNVFENQEITIMINQFSMLMPKDSTILDSLHISKLIS